MFLKLGNGISCALVVLGLAGCGMEPIPEEGAARGEVLFQRCSPCHGEQGEGNPFISAPVIAGQDVDYLERQLTNFADGTRGKHADDLEGIRMMPMARTLIAYQDGQPNDQGTQINIEALAAYVSSLPAVIPERYIATGDVQAGQGLYTAKCAQCHGDKAQGGPVEINDAGVNLSKIAWSGTAPKLTGQADWYLVKQIEKFRGGVRGGDASKDPAGATMVFWAKDIADEQAAKDVVSYIATIK
jgi:cytochrome c oxidase subunit 2